MSLLTLSTRSIQYQNPGGAICAGNAACALFYTCRSSRALTEIHQGRSVPSLVSRY